MLCSLLLYYIVYSVFLRPSRLLAVICIVYIWIIGKWQVRRRLSPEMSLRSCIYRSMTKIYVKKHISHTMQPASACIYALTVRRPKPTAAVAVGQLQLRRDYRCCIYTVLIMFNYYQLYILIKRGLIFR